MPRRMVISDKDGMRHLLAEMPADNEAQLQELVKDNPDLLPLEEFGLAGPLMVVGRETVLPSGGVDLVALTVNGDLLVIEFKTGPQNTDFRRVLAQLLDYGSDLWGMTFEEFEKTVAVRYFASDHCREHRVKGQQSLDAAARAIWTEPTDDGFVAMRDTLEQRLAVGDFDYVVVAQRFVPTVERTIGYLNATMGQARFHAVELVRFKGESFEAFESRTVLKSVSAGGPSAKTVQSEVRFLEGVEDDAYRQSLRDLLDVFSGLKLRFEWGTAGTPIRLPTPDRSEPLTIAWLFPPGRKGWSGLTDLTLGYDASSAKNTPSIQAALNRYLGRVEALPGAVAVKPQLIRGRRLEPAIVVRSQRQIGEIVAQLVEEANQGEI